MGGWVGECYTRLPGTPLSGWLFPAASVPGCGNPRMPTLGQCCLALYQGWLSPVSTNHSILCGYPGLDVVQV